MALPPAQRSPSFIEVRWEGEVERQEINTFEDELRRGQVPLDAEIKVGETWVPLSADPRFVAALGSPDATFAHHLRQGRPPLLTVALVLLLGALAAVQSFTAWPLQAEGEGSAGELRSLLQVAGGYQSGVLEGRPWTALIWHFFHSPDAPLFHLASNLLVLLYCGLRVERAWGPSGVLAILAGAIFVASTLVSLFTDTAVIGSSSLAFGLWGAQIAIGFRMGETIPRGWRGFYGYGNLLIFVPLYVVGLFAPGVSDAAHLGGFLGGALAVFLGAPATARPQGFSGKLPDLGRAALLLVLAPALHWGMGQVPLARLGSLRPVAIDGAALEMQLPSAVSAGVERFPAGVPIVLSPQGLSWLVALQRDFRTVEAATAYDPGPGWARRFAGRAEPALDLPAPLGEHWQVRGWWIHADKAGNALPEDPTSPDTLPETTGLPPSTTTLTEGNPPVLLIEHHLRMGRSELSLMEVYLDGRRSLEAPIGRAHRTLLEAATLVDPPSLREAREKHRITPEDPRAIYNLALQLWSFGRYPEAEALLSPLTDRADGWAWDATRLRLSVWEDAKNMDDREDISWIAPFLDSSAGDLALHRPALRWMIRKGACPPALEHYRAMLPRIDAWAARPDLAPGAADDLRTAWAGLRTELETACGAI